MKIRYYPPALFFLALISLEASGQTNTPHTGLGTCVDFIASGSTTLTNQINNNTTYTIAYGPANYTDTIAKIAYIQHYSCDSQDVPQLYFRVSALAHEFGHVNFNYSFPVTTRQAYIDEACKMEGLAVINNITARNEIWNFPQNSADIKLAASNTE
ncbi:hypothetical protein [Xanthomonas theicola]|uniref:hypothetical protein n=1 Tax=Xanthomonas theicola TaxID=56464 RepID=UPI001FE9A243|nr:hypothetical protein [Xanthomonas theicola]